jgi:hypothetical protein
MRACVFIRWCLGLGLQLTEQDQGKGKGQFVVGGVMGSEPGLDVTLSCDSSPHQDPAQPF